MSAIKHCIRLPLTLDKALRQQAERRGISAYALLQHCVRKGLASLDARNDDSAELGQLTSEIVRLGTGQAGIERVTERALYVSCAAYTYARAAALGTRTSDDKLTAEIEAAFARQLAQAQSKGHTR